ncbi:MAG: protein kinase domain-containing protein [Blastocatellia bacterium]
MQPSRPSPVAPIELAVTEVVQTTPTSRDSADPLLGRALNQKYQLEARLGQGGMGTVYRARRVLIGDTVAVKILHPEYSRDDRVVERFRREAQATALLKHPNAVTVYDVGLSEEGLLYFAMEFVEGQTLRAMLRKQGPLTQGAVVSIMRQVCAALDEAHRHGVVHRDLKPENILVQQTPTVAHVKVLDFGVASLGDLTVHKLTQSGSVVGTPHYMSPEHCMGEELDGRSDVYSLGIVLFEMLTGAVPFNSSTTSAIVVQHVNQPPPLPRSINMGITPAVEAVVLRALAKRREDRPATAGALAQELHAAASGAARASQPADLKASYVSIPQPPSSSKEAAPMPREMRAPSITPSDTPLFSRYNRMLVPALFGALLFVAGIAMTLWWHDRSSHDRPIDIATPSPVSSPPVAPAPPSGLTKFWEVIADQTSKATNIESVLGKQDGQMAIIEPGGQLALDYRAGQFFGDGDGVDLRIHGHKGDAGVYSIFLRDDPNQEWQPMDVNRRGFPQGVDEHDIHAHAFRLARQILIKNIGATELHIDAVEAVYKDTISSTEKPHHQRH